MGKGANLLARLPLPLSRSHVRISASFAKAMRINGEVLIILVGFHREEEEEYTEIYL
jgi:hypothetical protein